MVTGCIGNHQCTIVDHYSVAEDHQSEGMGHWFAEITLELWTMVLAIQTITMAT